MKIFHIIKVIFDRRTPAITDEWLARRYEFFARNTLPSLERQTLADWALWVSFGVNCDTFCVDKLRPHLLDFNRRTGKFTVVTFDKDHLPTMTLAGAVPVDADYVYVTRIDSDDLFAPDALQLANDCRPLKNSFLCKWCNGSRPDIVAALCKCGGEFYYSEDNLKKYGIIEASVFKRGYMHDVRTGQVGVYVNHSSPFHTMMIPRDVFCDPEKYKALDYGDHSKVYSAYPTQTLPDWRFTVLVHGDNFISTMDYANEPGTWVEKSWSVERFLRQPVTFDVDDFCDRWNCLPELDAMKAVYPDFRCTLFTILEKTSRGLLMRARERDWIELAVHGLTHEPNEELRRLSGQQLTDGIIGSGDLDFRKLYAAGFRPPGWYIEEEHVEALNSVKMWVALHKKDERWLGPLCKHGYYVCGDKPYGHFHTSGEGQNAHKVCGNGIRECLPELLERWPRDQSFSFVSDSVVVPQRGAAT